MADYRTDIGFNLLNYTIINYNLYYIKPNLSVAQSNEWGAASRYSVVQSIQSCAGYSWTKYSPKEILT